MEGRPPPPRSKSHEVYANNIVRLKLGKTKTEFFSARGNNRLKRIWLDNDLDDEMIFSSWIGPSQALLRQNVSNYLQAFLIRRAQHVPFYNSGMFSMLRRLSTIRNLEELSASLKQKKDKHPYYNMFIKSTLGKNYEQRQKQEKARVAKAIANGELPAIPGFEYVVKNPVYKAHQLETRLRKLRKIPMPYSEEDFEKHILPIMTAIKISKEKMRQEKSRSANLGNEAQTTSCEKSRDETHSLSCSSGFSDGFPSSCAGEDSQEDDSDLIQVFSEMDLKADLNDTLSDVCEVCGGLTSCGEVSNGLDCSCMSDPFWEGKNDQTASALYEDASKIVEMYLREHKIGSEYMEKYESISWLTKL